MSVMTEEEKEVQRALGLIADPFVAGMLYAIQQLVLYGNAPDLAADMIIRESNIGKNEFIIAQRVNGHCDETMLPFLEEVFKDIDAY